MPQDYNPDSIDAVLSRIENTLNIHVNETKLYRQHNDLQHDALLLRVSELEGDKKKVLGMAIGAGCGSGGLILGIGKVLFG